MAGKNDIPHLREKISKIKRYIEDLEVKVRSYYTYAQGQAAQIPAYFEQKLTKNAEQVVTQLSEQAVQQYMNWEPELWTAWKPPIWNPGGQSDAEQFIPAWLRIGDLIEERSNGTFKVPAMIPFIGADRTVIVKSHSPNYEPGNPGLQLLQSLIIRIALMLPHQTTYTLIDPAGLGAAFPMRRHLPHVRENSGDIRRDLEGVIQDIQRINETYLDASYPSFELVNPEIRINERFQFVFAADFPNKYDRRSIEALQSIATTGPRTGTYVFVHYNTINPVPRDIQIDEFRNAYYLDLAAGDITVNDLKLQIDTAPDASLQNQVFQVLSTTKPQERKVEWETEIGLGESNWWTGDSSEVLQTPIGVRGASGELNLWFGENREGQPCAHGMLGAMTGAGKSNLYHVFILGLAIRYSPDEIRFFLVDGKDGVEFQPYRKLPHAEVVSLKSSPQLSRSVLQELVSERERRNKIFSQLGITDLKAYRELGQPQGKMPRILLLIDEYQELFEGDNEGIASSLLLQIAQQGRSAGIYMLLGSQRFGAVGMLNQTAIFGNIHLRLAMQMTNSDVDALTEFGRRGKQLIKSCDLPGKIVVNDRSGDDGANEMGKVAFLTSEKRQQLITQLDTRAAQLDNVPTTIVFDGQAQPNFIENQYVEQFLHQKRWLSYTEFENRARQPIHEGGLNIVDWFSAEHPKVIWLGQEFSVRGQASMILRRRVAENIMIIGAANAVRYGILGAIIASLALNAPPEDIEFMVMDNSIPRTAWSNTLFNVVTNVLKPVNYSCRFFRDSRHAEMVLDHLLDEMRRRREMSDDERVDVPSIFAVLTDLDRVDTLRRRADSYGMSEAPLGDKLQTILIEGASLGVHLVMSFSGVRIMSHVVDERHGLLNFRHRVALQMSEDESLTFVRSRKAARLQLEGSTPIIGLYMDVESDKTTRFKPYTIESTIDYDEQMQQVGERLKAWSSTP